MEAVQQFDPQNLQAIRRALQTAVNAVAADYGISLTLGRCTYDRDHFDMKIQAAVIGQHGVVQSRERQDFLKHAAIFDLTPDDLDRPVILNGVRGTILGLKMQNPRYPILVKLANGKTVKCTPTMAQFGLRHAAG